MALPRVPISYSLFDQVVIVRWFHCDRKEKFSSVLVCGVFKKNDTVRVEWDVAETLEGKFGF
jgi:hypothetical protein